MVAERHRAFFKQVVVGLFGHERGVLSRLPEFVMAASGPAPVNAAGRPERRGRHIPADLRRLGESRAGHTGGSCRISAVGVRGETAVPVCPAFSILTSTRQLLYLTCRRARSQRQAGRTACPLLSQYPWVAKMNRDQPRYEHSRNKLRAAVEKGLALCRHSVAPIVSLATIVDELQADPSWTTAEVRRVDAALRRILARLIRSEQKVPAHLNASRLTSSPVDFNRRAENRNGSRRRK